MGLQTYRELRGHDADFLVKYRLFTASEGGRQTLPFQHLRCDFLYDGVELAKDGLWMIHPEFLDASGQPLIDDVPVPLKGMATMWIINPQMRATHRRRISVEVRGYMMEGARKIGEVEVIEVLALHDNPDA